jgi:hypothetical protein
MQECAARDSVHKQILRPPLNGIHALPGQSLAQLPGHGPAQTRLTHDDGFNPPANEMWGNPPPCGFDFG